MTVPIPFVVTRFRCPFCPRTASSKKRTAEHIGRCWHNPQARSCKTCKHYEPAEPSGDYCFPGRPCNCNEGTDESCAIGVSLAGRGTEGDDDYVRPGLIVGCDKWEAKS